MARFGKPIDEIPGRSRRSGVAQQVVEEFLKVGSNAYEVRLWAKPASVVASLRKYLSSADAPVKVVTRGDNVYLARTGESSRPKRTRRKTSDS